MYCGVASDARGAAAGLRPALVHAAGFAAAPLQREYTRTHAVSLAAEDFAEATDHRRPTARNFREYI